MSENNETKKLQEIILDIAKEVKHICQKHNIKYFIGGGTLLGAVRHKGFIPWDDDFDFVMIRSEYERFIEACNTELDKEKYFLQNEDTEEYYCFAFTKIQLKGTEIQEDFSINVPVQHGIFVDIFPYDNLPDDPIEMKKMLKINHLLKNLMWVKCGYGTKSNKKRLSYWVLRFFSIFLSRKQIRSMRYKLLTKYNNKLTKLCFPSDYPNVIQPSERFENSCDYCFENTVFPGFKDAYDYLSSLYGDYMVLPPEEKRVVHSEYKVNFGKYQ